MLVFLHSGYGKAATFLAQLAAIPGTLSLVNEGHLEVLILSQFEQKYMQRNAILMFHFISSVKDNAAWPESIIRHSRSSPAKQPNHPSFPIPHNQSVTLDVN